MDSGVNLGNWLVLEKWMSPELFAGTDAEDETNLCLQLDDTAKRERFKVHRDTWITDRDFVYLAAKGIDFVRLPVGYFVFGDHEPYVGCVDYVDRAFEWAEARGIRILLDLHTVPESQNGFDNGGLCGVCKFHTSPEHARVALDVLEQLTDRYGEREGLWGIEVLNEPVSPELWEKLDIPNHFKAADPERAKGSEPVPTEFLKDYFTRAYATIRAKSDGVRVVFHDGFRIREWPGFFDESDFTNFVVDTHMYVELYTIAAGDSDLADYIGYVEREFAPTVKEMSQHFPVMVGEWCIDTASKKTEDMSADERVRYYATVAAAHFKAWEPTVAWCYWAYRHNVATPLRYQLWDLLSSVEQGYLPKDFNALRSPAPAEVG